MSSEDFKIKLVIFCIVAMVVFFSSMFVTAYYVEQSGVFGIESFNPNAFKDPDVKIPPIYRYRGPLD